MSGKYDDAVAAATQLIAGAVLANEADLVRRARDVDRMVLGIVREVGRQTTEQVLNTTAVAEARRVATSEGLTPQSQVRTPFLPSLGKSKSRARTSGTRRRR